MFRIISTFMWKKFTKKQKKKVAKNGLVKGILAKEILNIVIGVTEISLVMHIFWPIAKKFTTKFHHNFKVYIIQVGSRNNFRLAGWNLGSLCIYSYHVTLLNLPFLYPHFENELRKSAHLSTFFNGISRFRDMSQLLPRSSSMGYQSFVINRLGFKLIR